MEKLDTEINAKVEAFFADFKKSYPDLTFMAVWTTRPGHNAPTWTRQVGKIAPMMEGMLQVIPKLANMAIKTGSTTRQKIVQELNLAFEDVLKRLTTGE